MTMSQAIPRTHRGVHICFVALNTYPALAGRGDLKELGGAQVQQSILARAFAAEGYRVSMVSFDYGQGADTEVDGVRIVAAYAQNDGLPGVRFVHPRLTRLWQTLASVDADIYYQRCAGLTTGVVAAFAKFHGKKFIYAGASDLDFSAGPDAAILPGARDRMIYRWGLRNASAIVAQNPRQQVMLRTNYGLPSVLVPSCYDIVPSAEADCVRREVLWVGMMRPLKRPDLFLAVARQLPEYQFRMIGGADGESPQARAFFESIKSEAARLKNVEFMGFVPYAEVGQHFDRARLFVNTSDHEGFPNTFLQAWARGVPSVAFFDTGSRLDGAPVYPVVQGVDHAVETIRRLMQDERAHVQASRLCAEFFSQSHSPEITMQRYEKLFSRLLKSHGASMAVGQS